LVEEKNVWVVLAKFDKSAFWNGVNVCHTDLVPTLGMLGM